jgi:4-hydroxy-3-methylbut-2-enyl diphosphate reductase
MAPKCDMVLVIGSRNSSNSARLVEVAKKSGCKNSILLHSDAKIPFDDLKKCKQIGISSGASAPEKLVQDLINEIKKDYNVTIEELSVAEEKVVFKLPKELN